ncbi:hypothetical protein ES707_15696 [subsurface metagenome]
MYTSLFISSRFLSVMMSGTVSRTAMCMGTPTSLMSRFGSGEITVLAEKSTLFPERLPLNRPSFPFSLWARLLRVLPDLWRAGGMPETSLLKYVVTWYWRSSERSSMMRVGAPASMFSLSLWLILMMSTSLWVRSSSALMPDWRIMLGRTSTGGTGRTWRTIHSGLATE